MPDAPTTSRLAPLTRLLTSTAAPALVDQGLISAANFLTMVLVARGLHDQDQFGLFVLAYMALLMAGSFQSGLITQPHNVLGAARRRGAYRRYTAATAASQVGVAALLAVGSLLATLLAWALGSPLTPLLLPLAPVVVAWQVQEFCRRVLYTEGRLHAAVVNDSLSYGGQLVLLSTSFWLGMLGGVAALWIIGATSALAAGVGVWQLRRSIHWPTLLNPAAWPIRDWHENWVYGRWLVASEMLGDWLSKRLYLFVGAAVLTPAAAGVLAAAQTLFGPARIPAYACRAVLPSRFARALADQGPVELDRQLRRALLGALPLLGGYCLFAAVFARPLLGLTFGDDYRRHAPIIAMYAAVMFFGYAGMIVSTALRAQQLSRAIFTRRVWASVLGLPVGVPLLFLWGHDGGLEGAVLGMATSAVMMCVLYFDAYRRHKARAMAAWDDEPLRPRETMPHAAGVTA